MYEEILLNENITPEIFKIILIPIHSLYHIKYFKNRTSVD